ALFYGLSYPRSSTQSVSSDRRAATHCMHEAACSPRACPDACRSRGPKRSVSSPPSGSRAWELTLIVNALVADDPVLEVSPGVMTAHRGDRVVMSRPVRGA